MPAQRRLGLPHPRPNGPVEIPGACRRETRQWRSLRLPLMARLTKYMQKLPIDVLTLPPPGGGTAPPIFLQQAAHLTEGIYWRWNGRGGLLQYLHVSGGRRLIFQDNLAFDPSTFVREWKPAGRAATLVHVLTTGLTCYRRFTSPHHHCEKHRSPCRLRTRSISVRCVSATTTSWMLDLCVACV